MTPIIFIPARLGSTRLPGKVLADIAGLPMIVHVLRRAQEAGIGPVAVACCEAEVAETVERAGGLAVMTAPELPSGSDRIHAALQAFDPAGRYDVVINLQGDLPAVDPDYLAQVLRPLAAGFDIGTPVAEVMSAQEAASPSVVKCACVFPAGAEIAQALYFSRNPVPAGEGPLWHHVGIYAFRRAALEQFVTLPPSGLEQRERLEQLRAMEAGMRIGVVQVPRAPFGVDTAEDLAHARRMMGAAP